MECTLFGSGIKLTQATVATVQIPISIQQDHSYLIRPIHKEIKEKKKKSNGRTAKTIIDRFKRSYHISSNRSPFTQKHVGPGFSWRPGLYLHNSLEPRLLLEARLLLEYHPLLGEIG